MQYLIKKLEISWRLFGTGLSFLVFGIGGVFLGVIIFPLLFVFVRNQVNRQFLVRRLIGRGFTLFVQMMRVLGVLSYKIEGAEQIGAAHTKLIIANHPTLIDVVFLVSLFPQSDCVIKKAVTRNPFMLGAVLPAKYISSDDTGELLDACVERLQSGSNLILFPEGTRSVAGQRLEFKLGAAAVAIRSGTDILPITIKCTQTGLLKKHTPWYSVPPERPIFTIKIHPCLNIRELLPDNPGPHQAIRSLNTALLEFFENNLLSQ